MSVLLKERKNKVLYLTLNRPENRNALNSELINELISAINQAENDEDVNVVVIRSNGDKAFCAGADLKELKNSIDQGINSVRKYFNLYANLIKVISKFSKVSISGVKGYALAGGCGLAVACDITLADNTAKFGIPEINIGLWGMIISAPILKNVIPKKAWELFLTGKIIDAQYANSIGLITTIVDNLDESLENLAQEIATKDINTIKLAKQVFWGTLNMNYFDSIDYLKEMSSILAFQAKNNIENFLNSKSK
ncbi:MAG: enoyl-CoA hydratase/isomerase family protein [bacterium]|nr:enoyl-CoA hydratase/isomerase family protein [bacterium]